MEVIPLLLARMLPAVPRLSFAIADVRDIGTSRRLGYGNPGSRRSPVHLRQPRHLVATSRQS